MSNNLLISEDGSHTLMSKNFEVTYHSKYGAINESMTVFINAGYHYEPLKDIDTLSIFEMGFGTGLNPLLTLKEAETDKRKVIYTGIEAYPISIAEAKSLNYVDVINGLDTTILLKMHGQSNEQNIKDLQLSEYFTFNKIIVSLENHIFDTKYDIIYFDAFAPTTQPHLWEEPILKKLYDATANGGILVTYCAKGIFKRALKSVGYTLESLPGPKGKREMTRAIKN